MPDPAVPNADAIPDGIDCRMWEEEPAGLSEVARKRRAQIIDAAEAVIAGEGIDELSLKKIETRAGMTRGQLTYYFPTRESILLSVYERMLRRLIRERLTGAGPKPMTGQARDCFQFALASHLGIDGSPFMDEKRDLFSLLYTFLAQMGHREDYRDKLSETYREWREVLAADVADSVPEPRPVDPLVAASILQALVHGLSMQLLIDPEAFDRAAMYDACARLLAPLFGSDGPRGSRSRSRPQAIVSEG